MTPAVLGKILSNLFKTAFGGKIKGRFKIARKHLTGMVGNKYNQESFRQELAEQLLEVHDLVMIELEDYVCLVDCPPFRSYRPVPKHLIKEFFLPKKETEIE